MLSKDKIRQYFYLSMGYIGIFFVYAALIRYSMILDDTIGRVLILFGLISQESYIRYAESQFRLPRKENLIFKSMTFGVFLIISIIGLFFIK